MAKGLDMGDDAARAHVLSWRGVLAQGSVNLRRMVAGVLTIMCVAPVFTQWGFVGVRFADGGAAYLMFMLVPVALTSLLLGALPGTAAGLLSGAALYFHSCVNPLDYYEFAYVTPVTSVVMMAVFGLVLGSLLSLVLRGRWHGMPRALLVGLACLAASSIFSLGCAQALGWRVAQSSHAVGLVVFQAVADAVLLALVTLVGLVLGEREVRRIGGAGLRVLFGAWLFALVLVAFMVIGGASYEAITASRFADATTRVRDEVEFVLGRVERIAGGSQDVAGLSDALRNDLLTSLFDGYSEDVDGLLVILRDGIVIGADDARVSRGLTLAQNLGAEVESAANTSVSQGSLERVLYVGMSETDDLVDLVLPGTKKAFEALLTLQVGYLMAVEGDGYRVVMIRPASMVFDARDDVVRWVSISSFVLLVSMLALARRLLGTLVAGRIDTTNEALARITDGDLEVRVEPVGTSEFQELAAGINATVDALRGWIAEAESRMDAELATAKVIQESALPSVFPPFPDIQRFDLFASMNAAREVGGDFYDFFLVGDDCGPHAGKLAFVMADVSGKGVPAALFMMRAKTQIHDYLESGMELGAAVDSANRMLCLGNEEGMFATVWVGVLDYATGHVDYVNAGHNPPLLCQRGSWSWVKQLSGMPLGLFDDLPYTTYSLDCEVGDRILLYTDGVTEAFSAEGEQYGEERLLTLAQECLSPHPHELVERVRTSVAEHSSGAEQSDDITLLALEVGMPHEEKVGLTVASNVDEIESVMEFLHAEMDRRLCPMRAQNQLGVAVEELFVNSCAYAYEGVDPSVERTVRVTCSYGANPRSLTVEVIDDGMPFDPLAQSDAVNADLHDGAASGTLIGGLGILMARKSVEEMRYERVGKSNVVTLVKRW